LTLAFYKYEFELTSLKPIKDNLNSSEKVLNKIFFQIEKAEEKIKDLNLSGIFKKDMNFLMVYSHENFIPLILQFEDIISTAETPFKEEIEKINNQLKQNFEKFQKFLNEIIDKTPEIIGPFEQFKSLTRSLIPEIYNLLDKLRKIFEDILPEIDEKIFELYTERIRPILEITDKRREKKSEFKKFKKDIDSFMVNFKVKNNTSNLIKPKKSKSKKKKSKKVKKKKKRGKKKKTIQKNSDLKKKISLIEELSSEYLIMIDKLQNFTTNNNLDTLDVELINIILFSGNLQNLKKYTNEAFKIVKEIDIFLKELNFGVIFQEDLNLLNDIFYDYFNPLMKCTLDISEKYEDTIPEEFKELVNKFKSIMIKTQDKLKEVIEYSIEPLKKIDVNLDLVLSPFSEIKNSLRKITIKSSHILSEIKNIWKYVLNIARIISNKYLGELKNMRDELLIYNNKLNKISS